MDQFDKSSRIFQTAQKTYSWTSRFIEAAMTFLTVNARPAYEVRNDLHLTDYSMRGHIYHATISNAKKLHARTIVQGMDQIILRSDN